MRMKRFVSVLAAAVMVFGVTGCNAITIDGENRKRIRRSGRKWKYRIFCLYIK